MENIKQRLSKNMETGKSTAKIAIIAVHNRIKSSIVNRFLWAIERSEPEIAFDVFLGKHKKKNQTFFKTVILNDLLRKTIPNYDFIVQTDIDMLIPPGLIRATYQHGLYFDGCYHANYYLVKPKEIKKCSYKNIPWEKFLKRKPQSASGSWNGMRNNMWDEIGGFCERIISLGGPDSEFYIRSKKHYVNWKIVSDFALGHVNHSRRPVKKQGKKNLKIARSYSNSYNWLKNRNPDVCKSIIETYHFGE